MANKILLRRNSTASAAPTAAQIEPGELAINTADGRLFTELNNGTIVNLPVQSIAGQAISPSSVTTTGALDTPNVKSKIYTAVTGDAGGWYPLFTIDIDQVITCSLRTLYHSSVLFTVSISYSAPAITVLHSSIQPNSSYANVNAIRINGGVVEVKLNWITGPSVQISAQISGSGTLPNFAATLVQNTNVVTPADSVDLVDKQTRFTRLQLSGTTASTSTTTGALVVDGGAGVAGTLWATSLGATANATIGAANSTRINIAGVGGANAVSEYYLAEANPRWQIGRDLIGGGFAGIGFSVGGANTMANNGVAIGYAAARELGIYTSNASGLTERVRVDNVGNVGIGTSDPQYKLEVNGSLAIGGTSAYTFNGNAWGYDKIVFRQDVNNKITSDSNGNWNWLVAGRNWTLSDVANVGIGILAPGSKLVVKGAGITSAASALNVTNSADNSMLFVRNDGYVGLSTTNPTARLTVFGIGTGTMECGATGHGGNYTGISFNNSGNSNVGVNIFSSPTDQTLYFNRPSGAGIRFREANADQVIIASDGNVGIGTTTPTAPLTLRKDVGTTANPGAVFADMIAFKAYYTGYDTETVKAAIGSGVDGITNWNTRNGLLTFSTANAGTLTERMRIMANGNVGIGQTEPTTKLDISHAGGFGLRINNTNTGGHYWAITAADSGFSSGNDRLLFIPNNLSSSTAAKVAFKTDGAIGAGTYNPDGMLHAHSTTTLSAADTQIENLVLSAGNGSGVGARHGIQFRAGGTSAATDGIRVCGIYQTVESASANATGLAFHTSSWTTASTSDQERVRIASNGSVGIGVTAPASRLVVKGEGLTSATSALNVTNSSDGSLLFVRNDGNVGVGQASPSYKLEVNGSFAATTKSFRIKHPSKPHHILEYGSLESPYHGVRLTGRGKVSGSSGQVALPEYLKNLVHDDERVTIQLTNYRHGKLLYVSAIDLQHDAFFVACDTSSDTDLEFFWCLTAVRKDIDEMVVERATEFGF